jgi:hypothetical protein
MTLATKTAVLRARGPLAQWLALSVVACARPGLEVSRLPNDANQLRCQSSLAECLSHADALCKGSSYEVLYAKEVRHVFGTDQSQVQGQTSEAEVHCLGLHAKPARAVTGPAAADSASAPATSSAAAVPTVASPPPAPRACVPGTTQTCVGPGACAGGQACLADGSAFGACDCGTAGAANAVEAR